MKPFTTIAVVVFSVIAVMHLLRLLLHWQVTVNSTIIPMWISILGCIFPGLLAVMLTREAKK